MVTLSFCTGVLIIRCAVIIWGVDLVDELQPTGLLLHVPEEGCDLPFLIVGTAGGSERGVSRSGVRERLVCVEAIAVGEPAVEDGLGEEARPAAYAMAVLTTRSAVRNTRAAEVKLATTIGNGGAWRGG